MATVRLIGLGIKKTGRGDSQLSQRSCDYHSEFSQTNLVPSESYQVHSEKAFEMLVKAFSPQTSIRSVSVFPCIMRATGEICQMISS